jgi:hypothetical protein
VIKLFKWQLHVGIVVLIAVIIAPIVPLKKSVKVNAGVDLVVLKKMGVENRNLDELVQQRRFPKHKQYQ